MSFNSIHTPETLKLEELGILGQDQQLRSFDVLQSWVLFVVLRLLFRFSPLCAFSFSYCVCPLRRQTVSSWS